MMEMQTIAQQQLSGAQAGPRQQPPARLPQRLLLTMGP